MAIRDASNEAAPLLAAHISSQDTRDAGPCDTVKRTACRSIIFKVSAAMYSFATLGLFNSSIGAVLPLLSSHYSLTDLKVSFIFLVGPLGYLIAAQCSSAIHKRFGQFGIAFLGPALQIAGAGILCFRLPFGLSLFGFAFQGLGTGLLDGSWCAWAGRMEKANTISGLLHGSYSVGAAVGPILVVQLTEKNWAWYQWYYILTILSVFDFTVLCAAFRNEDAYKYQLCQHSEQEQNIVPTTNILHYPATWLSAAYFLTDVGVETAISGWVVSFMTRSRDATPFLAGLSSSGFWIGMAIGRLVMGPATDRLGVRNATGLYATTAVILEVVFVFAESPVVSVGLMVALGTFMGPLFPSGVIVLTQLLPTSIHVAAVSFVASIGQIGGALLPFAIGGIVQGFGIGVFQYAILLQSILALLAWVAFAKLRPETRGIPSGTQTVEEDRE